VHSHWFCTSLDQTPGNIDFSKMGPLCLPDDYRIDGLFVSSDCVAVALKE
jgi:hypothetical protein